MKTMNAWILVISVLFVTGCVPTTKYAWDNYDQKLYDHYKDPAEYDAFVLGLKATIDKGDESGKVPPGIYAEYGFVLFEKGKMEECLVYFQKEQDRWPESRVLMSKMSANARTQLNKNDKGTSKIIPEQTKEVSK